MASRNADLATLIEAKEKMVSSWKTWFVLLSIASRTRDETVLHIQWNCAPFNLVQILFSYELPFKFISFHTGFFCRHFIHFMDQRENRKTNSSLWRSSSSSSTIAMSATTICTWIWWRNLVNAWKLFRFWIDEMVCVVHALPATMLFHEIFLSRIVYYYSRIHLDKNLSRERRDDGMAHNRRAVAAMSTKCIFF